MPCDELVNEADALRFWKSLYARQDTVIVRMYRHILVVKPVLERSRILVTMTLHICDATTRDVKKYSKLTHICGSPFALPVHLVLGERDVLVVEVYAEFRGNLTQVLIGSPLKEANIHRTRLRTMYTGQLGDEIQTHCRSPIYRAS